MSESNKGRILPMIAVILFVVCMCLAGCAKEVKDSMLLQEELLTSGGTNYKTVQVRTGDLQKEHSGTASVLYPLYRNLYWDKKEAQFVECLVKEGQEVKQGDILMCFASEGNQVQIETLRIQLEETIEEVAEKKTLMLEELQNAINNTEGLRDHDLTIAEIGIEKLQAKYELFLYDSDTNISQIEQQIAELQKQTSNDVLVAPFDGVVEEVAGINEGDLVDNGQLLVTMYSTDRLLLKADKAADKLRYNMEVIIESGKKNAVKSFKGKVVVASNILPASVPQELTLIELEKDVTEEMLTGNIKIRYISEDIQEILTVERKAICREDGKAYVYILEEDMIQKRYVDIALDTAERVWILDGLEEGQTLIVN